jgi:hypothetical protein
MPVAQGPCARIFRADTIASVPKGTQVMRMGLDVMMLTNVLGDLAAETRYATTMKAVSDVPVRQDSSAIRSTLAKVCDENMRARLQILYNTTRNLIRDLLTIINILSYLLTSQIKLS